jgi:hypothetical protein
MAPKHSNRECVPPQCVSPVSPRRHRLWPGRAILFAILLSRGVSWTVACHQDPDPGTLGGKCEDNGCNTYCNSGLHCDNESDTCVSGDPGYLYESPTVSGPSVSGCLESSYSAPSSNPCASGTHYECEGDASPSGSCTMASESDSGTTEYCCAPTCTPWSGVFVLCRAPGAEYACDDPLTPPVDASTRCFTPGPVTGGHLYCCAPDDVCFPGSNLDDLLGCPTFSGQVYCTGSAAPNSSTACVVATEDAGQGIRGYCCEPPADADVDVSRE